MDELGEQELAILRSMSPERKLALVQSLLRSAWELQSAGVRLRQPELDPRQVDEAVRDSFRDATA
jgi:hypothetical protein